ncbi:MAG: hypothetical protein MSS98_04935, partial [Alphaproteobacteria bacterium]|nr:hypothetical protein [Alphaproteobacteria bacterium]
PWRRIHNVIAKAMSICVAVGNKVMDTRLPQPAGCGDKYDDSGLGFRRLFNSCCESFKYPSPDAKASPSPAGGEGLHRPWCHKILGTDCASRPSMTGGRGANSFGRSMIEMLGVLAIIGVLSVGGIAGYSKAMMMWKINVAINQYAHIIQGMIENQTSLRVLPHQHIDELLLAMGIIPESWNFDGTYIHDNLGNTITSYVNHMNEKTMTFEIYFGTSVNQQNISTKQICQAIIKDFIQPLHNTIYYTFLYQNSKLYLNWQGDHPISGQNNIGGDKFLKDVTPDEISEACSICENDGKTRCSLVLYF